MARAVIAILLVFAVARADTGPQDIETFLVRGQKLYDEQFAATKALRVRRSIRVISCAIPAGRRRSARSSRI